MIDEICFEVILDNKLETITEGITLTVADANKESKKKQILFYTLGKYTYRLLCN